VLSTKRNDDHDELIWWECFRLHADLLRVSEIVGIFYGWWTFTVYL